MAFTATQGIKIMQVKAKSWWLNLYNPSKHLYLDSIGIFDKLSLVRIAI